MVISSRLVVLAPVDGFGGFPGRYNEATMATTPVRLAEAGSGFLQQVALGPLLSRFAVDQVGAEERAAALAKRSIKKDSKVAALRLAVAVMDLTTLEGADTVGKVEALCSKARRPDPGDPEVPSVAAVCVYPSLVATARQALAGSGVKVASVATAFPSGQASLYDRVLFTFRGSAPTRSTW
jgi:deoxyribose-phosphate aldolase